MATALFTITAGELMFRALDGYELRSTALRRRPTRVAPSPSPPGEMARRYVAALPAPEGVDRAWFFNEPDEFPAPPTDPFLEQRYRAKPVHMMDRIYEFNERAITEFVCGKIYGLDELDDVFVYSSYTGNRFPTFRYPQDRTLPSALKTNRFGWRGHEIQLQRSTHTVRIAFAGASTTVGFHGYPFSYPEYVEYWLNKWAASRALHERFEIINAGHEGTNSNDIAAEVTDMVAPLDPDLVLYYEGSNQFWPDDFLDVRSAPPKPTVTFPEPGWLEQHSALAIRIAQMKRRLLGFGAEPRKPTLTLTWPTLIDEFNPRPTDRALPTHLPTIVADLETMRASVERRHAELGVASFVWLAYQGMKLDLPRQDGIWSFLNRTFWPFSYSHIRRIADFQNRVFANYARDHQLPFVDIASSFPQDPDLFRDAIHMTEDGVRLQGWIAFLKLLPIVKARLADGRWPRPVQPAPAMHPAFLQPRALMKTSDIKAGCSAAPASTK